MFASSLEVYELGGVLTYDSLDLIGLQMPYEVPLDVLWELGRLLDHLLKTKKIARSPHTCDCNVAQCHHGIATCTSLRCMHSAWMLHPLQCQQHAWSMLACPSTYM
eukprot:1136946-Pelagomonas_calceolata.AAC.5